MVIMDGNQDTASSQRDAAASNVAEGGLASGGIPPAKILSISMLSSARNNATIDIDPLPIPGADDTVKPSPGIFLQAPSAHALDHVRLLPRQKNTTTLMIPNAGRMLALLLTTKTRESTDHDATYRRWLETRSRDDLVELLIGQADLQADPDTTHRLTTIQVTEPLDAPPENYNFLANPTYLRLPALRHTPLNEALSWRIALLCIDQTSEPLCLQIDSEITIGRTAGDVTPDLDLTPFSARNKGVSRIHARIRPEPHGLILIDNDSSNGTFWNKMRLQSKTEQVLKEGDVIAFGRANFLVKIIKSPSVRDTKPLL